jgi:hypothetical protein
MVLPAAVLVNRSERGLLIIEARKTDFGPRSGCEGRTRSLFPAPSAKRGFREGEDRTAKLRRQVSGLQELDEGCLSTLGKRRTARGGVLLYPLPSAWKLGQFLRA